MTNSVGWPYICTPYAMFKNVFNMSKKKAEETIVNDELLEKAGAEPESHNLGDEVEQALEDHLEEGAVADTDNMIGKLEAQIAEKDDRHLRLYAEFENYKRRSQREKLDLMETAGRKTMMALLPALDDFDRTCDRRFETGQTEASPGKEDSD